MSHREGEAKKAARGLEGARSHGSPLGNIVGEVGEERDVDTHDRWTIETLRTKKGHRLLRGCNPPFKSAEKGLQLYAWASTSSSLH